MIVSHIHPSTVEGVALLSEAMVPALQDSASAGEEEFFWSVDIHCASGGDDSDSGGSDNGGGGSGSGDDGIGSDRSSSDAGGSDSGASDGERSGEERGGKAAEEKGEGGGGGGDSDSLGPSAYMARKVGEKS